MTDRNMNLRRAIPYSPAGSLAMSLISTVLLVCLCGTAPGQESAIPSVPSDRQSSGLPVDATGGPIGSGDGEVPVFSSIEEAMANPEFAAGRAEAESEFEDAASKLAELAYEMRETYIRYRNREERNAPARRRYMEQRREVERQMDVTYDAALDLLRYGGDETSMQFLVTMIEHRLKRDQYDEATLEGATRMLDGGNRLRILFEIAARSAIVVGRFDMAKQLYEAIDPETLEKNDAFMATFLDDFADQHTVEMAARQRDQETNLPRVKFETSMGDFVVELFLEDAPSTVAHFLRLCEQGYYDGLDFSQVVPEMLALSGDAAGDGTGNNRQFIMDENQGESATRRALRGSVLMAKIPTENGEFIPNSASTQFAILFLPKPHVHRNQTIIGRVIEGMDVVSRLRRIDPSKEKNEKTIEVPPDQIFRVEILRRPDELPKTDYLQTSRF